ncbi:MAG: hypothetical protein AAF266_08150 [Planctomycetota bacterium]
MPDPQFSSNLRQVHQGIVEAFFILQSWDVLSHSGSITPAVEEKFRKAIRSGPLLPSKGRLQGMEESGRDVAFELQVAADIANDTQAAVRFGDETKGGVDLYYGQKGEGVECKRPRKLSTVAKNVKEAARQIRKDPKCKMGYVALETSFLQNPKDDFIPSESKDPFAHDARLAGFMSDTMAVEIAKELCNLSESYLKHVARLVTYYCMPMLLGGRLGFQAAHTVIHRGATGEFIIGVDDGLMVCDKVPSRVKVVRRSQLRRIG